MVEAFNVTFGDDENDIEAWGRMCVLVGMEDIPDTLEARREVSKPFSSWFLIIGSLRSFLHRGAYVLCEKAEGKKIVLKEWEGRDSDPCESMRSTWLHKATQSSQDL